MAVMLRYTREQRDNQAQIICDLFGLEDASRVLSDFQMESTPTGALLTVSMVKQIDLATAQALLNGVLPGGTEG